MFQEKILFLFVITIVTFVRHYNCSGFPNVEASQGKIWPQPQVIQKGNTAAFRKKHTLTT